MKKNYLCLAVAVMVMAGCANEELIGDAPTTLGKNQPIAFNMNMPAVTRGGSQTTGKDAATALGQEFIVWGEKNEEDKKATTADNLVFKNYRVQYNENSANTTTSNTVGWDYVGIAPYAKVNSENVVSPNILSDDNANIKQTIKYWDLGKTYTFTAVSALKTDITYSKVKITKTEGSTELDSKNKGYTIVLTKGADATKIFVADRKDNVKYETTATSVNAVQMAFRNFQSKMRIGFYETVPGYDVQVTGVKYNSKQDYQTTFGVDGQFVQVPTGTGTDDKLTYAITYDTNNKPVVTVTTGGNTATAPYKEFGSYVFNKDLGKTANTSVVYDKEYGAYTAILPNTGNQTSMSFTVSYKLISVDTKEVINVADKKVTVPAAYCQWKPNFAYTYLFKISDQSTGLFPITFDAVVEADEVSKQETITEAGDPSITTFATATSDGKTTVVTGKDEYESGNVIYTVTDKDDGMTSTNTKLYTVTASTVAGSTGAVAPEITEASVANCLTNGKKNDENSPTTWTATDINSGVLTVTAVTINNSGNTTPVFVAQVPSEDGNGNRTINALKWSATGSSTSVTYYAVEYTYSDKKYYKIVKVAQTNTVP